MKAKCLFNKAILILAVVGLVGFSTNSAFSQQVKKKIIRVIEDDGKGEKVVKEYDITNNRQKFDSITRDVRKKMQIERIKIDSLQKIIMHSMPQHIEIPSIPEVPEPPFFDLGFDDHTDGFFEWDGDNDFEFVMPNFEPQVPKVFYSEKSLDKSGELDKILKDLENGTFDPEKYNMKEIEKDKLKDFKTNGKGEVIILGDHQVVVPPRFNHSERDSERGFRKVRHMGRGNMIYFKTDSLNGDEKIKTFTIGSLNDNDSDNEHVMIIRSNGNNGRFKYDFDENNSKQKRMIVITNDNGVTKFSFTNPTSDETKMLEKAGLAKVDESNLLPAASLLLVPQEEKDKYKITFKADESGKVKVVLTDDKGKTIKSEEFDYSKGKFEKEIELKDFNSGVYYIQAQLNNKTSTSKLKVTKD